MFTGIVEETGVIRAVNTVSGGRALSIEARAVVDGVVPGASIAVSGVCLTVTAVQAPLLTFDVIAETLAKSTLGRKRVGDRVNLERSLRAGDRIDGHFVQGHVDGTAGVDRLQVSPKEWVAWLRPQAALRSYLVPKGSVALDGVSLTIADLRDDLFSVALIPTTLERTTLAKLAVGDHVNVETDVITRTVVHCLDRMRDEGGLTLEKLKAADFL
ncbi:MAG: riboflavin synthase [Phycisphaerae bacterium]|nr:riboflavin synthase [Phycisphaerae bacterium]